MRLLSYGTYAVMLIVIIFSLGMMWAGYSQWIALVIIAIVYSLLTGYNSSMDSIQNAARKRSIVAFHGGLNNA